MSIMILAGGGGNFPPFDTTTFASQLLWLALIFGTLYILMSKVIVPRIGGILESRDLKISSDLKAAEQAKAEADKAGASFEKGLLDARNNAAKLASETREKMNAEQEQVKKNLDSQLATKMQQAEVAIAATKTKALASVNEIAAVTTSAIINQLTGKTVSEADIKTALAKFA